MSKKYKLLKHDYITLDGERLYRIQATTKIIGSSLLTYIKPGDLGGHIRSEYNLSQDPKNDAWVADGAKVRGNAMIGNNMAIGPGACIRSCSDFLYCNTFTYQYDTPLTAYYAYGDVQVICGWFVDSLDEFEKFCKSLKDGSYFKKELQLLIQLVRLRASKWGRR